MNRKYILDEAAVAMKLRRMAYEIWENNQDEEEVTLIGIQDNGLVIARNMVHILQEIGAMGVKLIHLHIDKKNPGKVELSDDSDLSGKVLIIVDDVANSGRTMLYSLKPFLDYHPKKIQTLALVERTHKAFPLNLDYKGLSVSTTFQEHIFVVVNGERIEGAYMD